MNNYVNHPYILLLIILLNITLLFVAQALTKRVKKGVHNV
jgi:ABC-type polysaccharide/polyol phosphate export permease